MGVGAYHHPNALQQAEDSSYNGQKMCVIKDSLKQWVDTKFFFGNEDSLPKVQKDSTWTGTAAQLLQIVERNQSYRREFKASNSLGRVLQNRVDLMTGEVTKNPDRTYTVKLD